MLALMIEVVPAMHAKINTRRIGKLPAEVPGGWLVLADTWAKDEVGHYDATGVSICFYPDALHEWTIEEEAPDEKKSGAE